MKKYSFTKMHSSGNDIVIIDSRTQTLPLTTELVQQLCNRRFGIGCDHLIILEHPKSKLADVFMRIFNADGNEVQACGNATLCQGSYLYNQTGRNKHIIETSASLLITTRLDSKNVEVNMGEPSMEWQKIPLSEPADTLFLPIKVLDLEPPAAVSMGNPHLVLFVRDVESIDLQRIGQELTNHPLFPQSTNVEIIQLLSRNCLRMRVWERGVGITPSCATGACASVVAAMKRGLLSSPATVYLDGGEVKVAYDKYVTINAAINLSFEGTFKL